MSVGHPPHPSETVKLEYNQLQSILKYGRLLPSDLGKLWPFEIPMSNQKSISPTWN